MSKDFCTVICSERERLKSYNDTELADKAGVKRRAWLYWKTGKHAPSSELLRTLILSNLRKLKPKRPAVPQQSTNK